MSTYIDHAFVEFRAAGWCDEHGNFQDEMQEAICNHVLKLLEVFSEEGHSGTTAPYTINLFKSLAMFEPIVPVTGEDWEWNEVSPGLLQNKRCSHVFKDVNRFDGQAYDIDAVIFYDWHTDEEGNKYKSYFTSSNSVKTITFPYTPSKEYVESV